MVRFQKYVKPEKRGVSVSWILVVVVGGVGGQGVFQRLGCRSKVNKHSKGNHVHHSPTVVLTTSEKYRLQLVSALTLQRPADRASARPRQHAYRQTGHGEHFHSK